jgi:hypothetical protein
MCWQDYPTVAAKPTHHCPAISMCFAGSHAVAPKSAVGREVFLAGAAVNPDFRGVKPLPALISEM